jgi:hypothetical protein
MAYREWLEPIISELAKEGLAKGTIHSACSLSGLSVPGEPLS